MRKTRKSKRSSQFKADTAVILMAMRFQFAAGERILNRWVQSRMLLWGQEGRGRVRVNGRWYPMQADDFLFLPWNHEVSYESDLHEPLLVGSIHLVPDYPLEQKLVMFVPHNDRQASAKFPWRRDIAWPGLDGVRAGKAQANEPFRLLAEYVLERFEEGGLPESSLRALSRLLVEEIARTLAQKPAPRTGNDVVRRAQELIETHLQRPIALHELARLSRCSVSTLRRQFQSSLGMPPYEWILQTRMRRARRLLSTTRLRIKEIAEQVGFDDPFQFSRTFRQRVGKSPRQYRADHAFAPKAFL